MEISNRSPIRLVTKSLFLLPPSYVANRIGRLHNYQLHSLGTVSVRNANAGTNWGGCSKQHSIIGTKFSDKFFLDSVQ